MHNAMPVNKGPKRYAIAEITGNLPEATFVFRQRCDAAKATAADNANNAVARRHEQAASQPSAIDALLSVA